jgi:hypothetical protein
MVGMRNIHFANDQQAKAAYNYKTQRKNFIRSMQLYGLTKYSGTLVHKCLLSRTNQFTNKFSKQKTSQVTNGVLGNERASRQQQLVMSWEYWQESISCCVTFAQYTSLLEFAVPSHEFHCVLWFFLYIMK